MLARIDLVLLCCTARSLHPVTQAAARLVSAMPPFPARLSNSLAMRCR